MPVKYVINTGGQDHRWFGNAFFRAKGAVIVASKTAVEDQMERGGMQWQVMQTLIGKDNLAGTELKHAESPVEDEHTIELGSLRVEIHHKGHAHTPGDTYVWLPRQKILFSGDIVYLDRMLGIGDQSSSASWLKVRLVLQLHPSSALDARHLAEVVARHPKRFEVREGPPVTFQARFTPREGEHPLRYLRWVLAQLQRREDP